jgi:hypothetical protein
VERPRPIEIPEEPSCQLIKQRLRLFQIARVKPFGEPAVDRSEKRTSPHRQDLDDRRTRQSEFHEDPRAFRGSLSSPTAIENECRAGHQRRGVGGEKDNRSGDFVQLAEATKLDLRQHFVPEMFCSRNTVESSAFR